MRKRREITALIVLAACVAWGAAAEEPGPPATPSRVERLGSQAQINAQRLTGGLVNMDVVDKPLQTVLAYLHSVSQMNFAIMPEKEGELLVTVRLENVTWRGVLEFIARKYGLAIDDSKVQQRIIFITRPEKVVLAFKNADIEEVINTIGLQSNANIVVGPEVKGKISMRLENIPWTEALGIVTKTLDFVVVNEANDVIRITTRDKLKDQKETRIFYLAYQTPEGAKYTATISSEFATKQTSKDTAAAGSTLIDVLTKMLSTDGKISFVKQGNALVVTDTPTKLDQMEQIIRRLDTAPKQVHVSVKIVSLTDDDTDRLGVNWDTGGGLSGIGVSIAPIQSWASAFPFGWGNYALSQTLLGGLAAMNTGGDIKPMSRGGGAGLSGGPGISLGSTTLSNSRILFEAIRTKTNGRLIQAPQLVTLDNEEATIQVGRLYRYAESFVANTEGGGNVSGYREAAGSPIKLGVQLLIIPHVTSPENNVMMTIVPKTEDLFGDPKHLVGPAGEIILQDTTQRIVVTKMLLRSGETGVIGGLRIDQDDYAHHLVPGLADIPILGRLFRHKSHIYHGENLMIFVTPTIVDLEMRDDFSKQLDKLRNDLSKPYAPVGEDEASPAPPLRG